MGNIKIIKSDLDARFDPASRKHLYISVKALDYDENGNNPVCNVVYAVRVHMNRKELETAAEHLIDQYIKNHYGVTVEAIPDAFDVIEALHIDDEGTEQTERGQIRFAI